MSDRDRDEEGRARNARPRDAYGRPLPYEAESGEPTVPDELAQALSRDPIAALTEAQRLLDADRPFHAHEVLEAVWKAAPDSEREFWRALAQVAVGITHLRRGNRRGAQALLERAADRLEPYRTAAPHGLDVATLISDARSLARHETAQALTLYRP
jgi:hypothetical protein